MHKSENVYFVILFKYILRNHLFPFLFAVLTLIAIFLIQFLMKYADRLIGKGLGTVVIIKLVVYNLAWMFVLVVPMAVLISTLMAFGAMAQNNEIAVMKSAGMSLYRTMLPPFVASILLFFFLVWFNNYVYPNANHAARVLMYDISKKKPTLSLVPGVFSTEIPGYSILARQIDDKTNTLENLTIYDNSEYKKLTVITARKGKIYLSKSNTRLIIDLYDGEIHETELDNRNKYTRIRFTKHKLFLPADEFTFKQSTDLQRGDRELGAPAMLKIVDSLETIRDKILKTFDEKEKANLLPPDVIPHRTKHKDFLKILNSVKDKITISQSAIFSQISRLEANKRAINRFKVEIHKKYALPFACIVFILIGAPLGTMLRKGGFGVASGVSLFFFLLYWAFLIAGEKLADRGMLSPLVGVWSANALLLILGIFLTYKSATERIALEFEFFKKIAKKFSRND